MVFGNRQMPKFYNPYMSAAVAAIGGSLFGFDVSSISAILGTDQYNTYFGQPSSIMQGGITAAMSGGSLIGSLLSGQVCDILGRKKTIIYSCGFWIIGSVLCCASQNVAMLIVGRVFNGLCVGFTSSQVPVYISELSRKDVRGKMVGIQQWSIEWGILIMYYIGYGCSYIKSNSSFRIPWGLQMIPAVLLVVLLPMFPESPRWLGSKGRWEEVHDTLAKIHAGGNREDPIVLAEIMEIREAVEIEQNSNASYLALFSRKNIYRTHVGIMAQVYQQLAGGNVMMYYVVYVFQMAGLTGSINLIASSIQYVVFLIFTFPVLFFIDKVGRRWLMIGGSISMGTCIWIVGGVLCNYGEYVDEVGGNKNIHITLKDSHHASVAVLFFSYLFTMFYSLTWAPTAWVYAPEVFPLYIRSKGMSAAAAGNWSMNFALSFYVPPAFDQIGWKTFAIFGVFNFFSAIHIYFGFPETGNKSLEEIDELFSKGGPRPWKTKVGHSHFDEKVEELVHEDEKPSADHVESVRSLDS
ncbi:hypothetical protein CANARDRAFT_175766 [[Candida] arabinofermentans NRRL YB-2248]|uniref:Major facilitator superfamily (MFS) profile domain-containing protein n=2 Tax=[Candida] arabinofermentans TaxID=130810 RepID=A0A1E4T2R0_9ASCO|nr:hypothetical protein CANARDRAFT_175766 [[Candida] arabinofermentans NRRL YB-2248]CAP08289.1 putative L-arabinose transporter [[Candida] arabinofermentans]